MQSISQEKKGRTGIHTFVRNRYFYGKLLDVFHFELEQDYFNNKRWLLNRLIGGYGVVCGLDVLPASSGRAVVVTPGIAIDQGGREIIVPHTSEPIPIPPRKKTTTGQHPPSNCEAEHCVHLVICFQQCESDPTPVQVDDCGQATTCSASSIQERYKCVIRECKAPEIDLICGMQDLMRNGHINYHMLVDRVTHGCPELPADLCIPLANIKLWEGNDPPPSSDIDINPRPIVYSNDLLFDLVLALAGETPGRNRGGKK